VRGALAALPSRPYEKAEVDRKLAQLDIEGTLRGEMLNIDQHLELCKSFG